MDDIFKPVRSSSIVAYSYDPDSMLLTVNFVSDPDTDHVYKNVPPNIVSQVFDTSRSVGKAFRSLIRGNSQYQHRKDV
jgi:hypothetical protein